MSEQARVLFLNPPGEQIYLRDYFCSKVSQADYLNQPIDFVFLSGFLKDRYDLHLIDAVVEKLDAGSCLGRIQKLDPEIIVGLVGSVSYAEDRRFYRSLSQRVRARLILIGDILLERRRERLGELYFVEAFLHDFSAEDLLHYLEEGPEKAQVRNMTARHQGGVLELPLQRANGGCFNLPTPQHGLFLDKGYRYPFVRNSRFATLMTDYGCPYRCTFCVMPTLGWKLRTVENVIEELELLHSMGIGEFLFLDQTFGIPRERARLLLQRMSGLPHPLGWVCFSRPDVVDEELLFWMKAAGCHTVILGLESGSQQILDSVKKDYSREQVAAGFRLCKQQGLRTVATVLLGLPEETEATFRQTIDFLKEVNPDFASFNVAVPRMGTPLREQAVKLGLIDGECETMDQSGTNIAMPTLALGRERIKGLRKTAVREFYFRLSYLRRCLWSWAVGDGGSVPELGIQLRQGYHLLLNYFRS